MNADHADVIDLYAGAARPDAPAGWRLTAIDPEGLDMMREGSRCRIDFATPVTDAASARQALGRLAEDIRTAKSLERKG
jgi:putative heme iron utilization protein